MSKTQYKYNPKTLSYEEVKVSIGKRLLRVLLWLAPNVVFTILLAIFIANRIDSPRERELEAKMLETERILNKYQQDIDRANKVLQQLQKKDTELYRVALYADEFPEELRKMGIGGSNKYEYLNDLPNSDLLKTTEAGIDALERKLHAQSLSYQELLKLAKNKEQMLMCIPSIQPVRNADLKRMASGYGYRVDPIYKTRRMHTGMDFTADKGTEVYATGDGTVELIENLRWGYGKSIIVNHGYGYKTRYAHLSNFNVSKGQKVKRGELIGFVGSTGKSTGPHLHYEVIKSGKTVNPIGYYHSDLSPEQYELLIQASENSHKALD